MRAVGPRVFSPPELDFDAYGFAGVQMVNGADWSPFIMYDKLTGGVVAGPIFLQCLALAGDPCSIGSAT